MLDTISKQFGLINQIESKWIDGILFGANEAQRPM